MTLVDAFEAARAGGFPNNYWWLLLSGSSTKNATVSLTLLVLPPWQAFPFSAIRFSAIPFPGKAFPKHPLSSIIFYTSSGL